MTISNLQDAVNGLVSYTEFTQATDVKDASLLDNSSEPNGATEAGKSSIKDALLQIMDTNGGSYTTKQIIKGLTHVASKTNNDTKAEIDKRIRIYTKDKNDLQSDNPTIVDIVGADGIGLSTLSVFEVQTVRITPANRNTNAVSVFLSSIPTLELSRCMPYLTIEVQTGRSPLTDDRVSGLTTVKFLEGSRTITEGERSFVLASLQKVDTTDELGGVLNSNVTVAGMDLFTAPQMMVNPDVSFDSRSNRAGPVIDKFRPFMSIERFTTEITPGPGFFAYRTADLELVLHDRSRLYEIADFIRADLYGSTELNIEYGWSHPDTSNNNAYGKLMNAMRVSEKYGVVNSSFSMTKSGEVKIKLRLFTKAGTDIQTVKICDDGSTIEAARTVRRLQKSIADIRNKSLGQTSTGKNKEIRGEQQLFANIEDIGSSLTLTDEQKSSLNTFFKGFKNDSASDNKKELYDALIKLYDKDGNGGSAAAFSNTISGLIRTKFDNIINQNDKKYDPFLFKGAESLKSQPNFTTKGYVSLGRLLTMFVAAPIASKNEYADIQLIFYPFNAAAGACCGLNTAEFPIHIETLINGLTAVGSSRGLNLTLQEFMSYISNNFIDDMSNPAYGLSEFYTRDYDKSTGTIKNSIKPGKNKDGKEISDAKTQDQIQQRLLQTNSLDGAFKPPQVDIVFELVSGTGVVDGQSQKNAKLLSILKIHVFDKCATSYEGINSLLLANREEDLRTIGNVINDANEHREALVEILSKAKNAAKKNSNDQLDASVHRVLALESAANAKGGLTKVDGELVENTYDVQFNIDSLRAFIRRTVPTIVYGSNNTGVKDASFSTQQNALMSAAHMIRAGETSPLAPSGLTKSNLPLRTIPAKVTMTTMGCPVLQYMQQFFIDFNTNTTIDNIYGINKLVHEISPGKFDSKIDFVPLDAYGRYESLPNQLAVMIQQLDKIITDENNKK